MRTKEKFYLIFFLLFMFFALCYTGKSDFEDYKASYSYYLQVNQLENTQENYIKYLKEI